jgi:hypothetical protein
VKKDESEDIKKTQKDTPPPPRKETTPFIPEYYLFYIIRDSSKYK